MQSLSRILLPVDFSERSAGAAHYARSLASPLRLRAHPAARARPAAVRVRRGGYRPDPCWRSCAAIAPNRPARTSRPFSPPAWPACASAGWCWKATRRGTIVEFAHNERVDLIVMPTHGYGPFRRFILGSNTAKVLHDADCPVWTGVHMEDAPATPSIAIGNVLCAVDLGQQSSKTLFWAARLAQEFGARLILLHVTACGPGVNDAASEELRRLQGFVGAEADLEIENGEPARVICAAAERLKADVLVIGRGSAAGVFGRLRTNAYAIIRQSPCPVVSV